jgi:hypothetical protein
MAAASIAQSRRRLAAGEASCTSGRSTICATDSSSCVLAQKSGGTTTDIRWHGARADGMQLAITDIQSWARVEQEDRSRGIPRCGGMSLRPRRVVTSRAVGAASKSGNRPPVWSRSGCARSQCHAHSPDNAFVLHPEERVVIDSGLSTADKDLMSDVAEVPHPADARWLWIALRRGPGWRVGPRIGYRRDRDGQRRSGRSRQHPSRSPHHLHWSSNAHRQDR